MVSTACRHQPATEFAPAGKIDHVHLALQKQRYHRRGKLDISCHYHLLDVNDGHILQHLVILGHHQPLANPP